MFSTTSVSLSSLIIVLLLYCIFAGCENRKKEKEKKLERRKIDEQEKRKRQIMKERGVSYNEAHFILQAQEVERCKKNRERIEEMLRRKYE